jgi:hypothetical protein
MGTVRSARLVIGAVIALAAVPCLAQEEPASSSGTALPSPRADSGALLLDRLDALSEGALPLDDAAAETKWDRSWPEEVERYAERSADLRARCHDEIRAANRDTIVGKAAQCLRSDLLLEITHRRKEGDRIANAAAVDPEIAGAAAEAIDAWTEAATAVIDGVDAGVFTTLDTLKEAKDNLQRTYRAPMFATFVRVRASRALHVLTAFAATVRDAMMPDAGPRRPFLDAFVPCLESARDSFLATAADGDRVQDLRAGTATFRTCVGMAEDERER